MKKRTKTRDTRTRDFIRGVEAAADIADQYNGSTLHASRLGDCILAKLNLKKGKIRKNAPSAWLTGSKEVGAYVYVHKGHGTGISGTIDFVDRLYDRYLVDAGGLQWFSIADCCIVPSASRSAR